MYLDNAATSHPKPEPVYEAMVRAVRDVGGSPGRGAHRRSTEAGRLVSAAREAVAELIGTTHASRVLFTSSCTHSLNLAIKGVLSSGDHCITTSIEHNSVARPLRALEEKGVSLTRLPCLTSGLVDLESLETAFRPNTRLLVMAHASNVLGALQPLRQVAASCRRRGVPLLLDAAQTAGSVPVHVGNDGVDLLAAPGHKGMLGPQGTGFLYVAPGIELVSVFQGGTGSSSEAEDQPAGLPEGYEPGTLNVPGIAGVGAAARFLLSERVERVRQKEASLVDDLQRHLTAIDGVTIFGPPPGDERASLVTISVEGWEPEDLAAALDSTFDIQCRAGLHCAPQAHRFLGTLPAGAVRFSPGYFNTPEEIVAAAGAVRDLAGSTR